MSATPHSEAPKPPSTPAGGGRVLDGVARMLRTALEANGGEAEGGALGAYRLVAKVGEGGFSTVWQAEQDEPIRRTVAVKVLKRGLDTEAAAGRFALEAEALAVMDHPNIARVLDAGATAQGRPFLVMELVRGEGITRFCDTRRVPLTERLRLFATVCRAVQHAHQKGIIHRDLKPSNVLVTLVDGRPEPKVIDFGIAKATEASELAPACATRSVEFLGTPAYVSPEQLETAGRDLDTRADVYGLGVLLYELLCGCVPFDLNDAAEPGLDRMRHLIREVDPPRPSARFGALPAARRAAVAGARAADAEELARTLRLDLDWIAMRCLEKDRARRYATADALAADVARYLAHEPLDARPPTRAYRWRKRLRRHRGAFASAFALVAVLVAGAGASAWQAIRATRAEGRAEAQAEALRRRSYAADLLLAQQALERDDLGQAARLLERQRPAPGEDDLRGWEWRYLWQFGRGEPARVLNDRPLLAERLAVSADGAWLATVDHDTGAVALWDLRAGTRRPLPCVPARAAQALVAFSPAAPLLAVHYCLRPNESPGAAQVVLWDFAREAVAGSWAVHHRRVGGGGGNLLAFSADGARLLAALGTDPVILSVADGTVLTRLRNPSMGCAAATPDLRLVAFERRNTAVVVHDTVSGASQELRDVAAEYVNALAFSPDGRTLATAGGGSDAAIRLWSVDTGREVGVLAGHHVAVQRMFFERDGRGLVSAAHDQTIRLWEVDARRCGRVLRGHRAGVTDVAAVGGDGRLVSAARDGTIRLWDRAAGAPRAPGQVLAAPVAAWRFAADASLLTVDRSGALEPRRPPAFAEAEPLARLGPAFTGGGVGPVGLAARKPWAASVTADGRVEVWDWSAGRLVATRPADARPGPARALVGFVADDRRLLLAFGGGKEGAERGLLEWDPVAPAAARCWSYPPVGRVPAFAVSSDGAWCLVSWNTDPFATRRDDLGPVLLVDLQRDRATILPEAVLWQSHTAAFTRDPAAAVVPWSRVSTSWRLGAAAALASLPSALCAAYAPDGGRLVLGNSVDDAICLRDAATGEKVFALSPPQATFVRAAFSADGDTLVAQTQFGLLHLWTVPSWREVAAAERSDLPWIGRLP